MRLGRAAQIQDDGRGPMRLGLKAHLSKLAGIEVERIVAAVAVDPGGAVADWDVVPRIER